VVVFVVIPLINVETLATWVVTLVVKAAAIVRATGEAVGSLSPEKSQLKSGSSSSSEPVGP
jgi:hypothetical protein